jgi:hypothetical protein
LLLRHNKVPYTERVQTRIEKAFYGIPWTAHNRFPLDVKGSIQDYRHTRVLAKGVKQFPELFIDLP